MADISIREYNEINIDEIIGLYKSVGWNNYTDNRSMLESAYSNSLKILSAWDKNKLIGIIRVVGDGYSIIYIQDMIVLPEYQRKGIGTMLFEAMDRQYPLVYQKVLISDDSPSAVNFYKKFTFEDVKEHECTAFVKYTI